MTAPLVSVVLPTYNHAHFLRRSVGSVLNQTLSDWELHIVDNSSTDDTNEVLASFKDPRIHVHTINNGGIIARSRNLAIRHASGTFVAFLDSDDCWYKEKLQSSTELLGSGHDLVCHGELWVGGDQPDRVVMYGPSRKASSRRLLHRGNCLSTSAVTMERKLLEAVGGFSEDPTFVTAEDYELWIRCAALRARIAFIPLVLGEFRRSPSSASSDIERNVAAEIAVCNHHFDMETVGHSSRWQRRQRRARAWYGAGRSFAARGNTDRAWSAFRRSLRLSPFLARIWPAMLLLAIRRERIQR